MTVYANQAFTSVNQSKKLYVVLKGSAGSGKSMDTAQHYILRLLQDKGRNLLCVRKSECNNRQSTYAELTSAIHRMGANKYFKISTIPMRIKCTNGNEIIFRGVNHEGEREKLKSITFSRGKLTDIWCEEASELQPNDIRILTDRLRGTLPDGLFFQIRLTFNPVLCWIKQEFFDTPRNDTFIHNSTYLDNRFIGKEFHERAEIRKRLDPIGHKIYYLNEWGGLEGLILNNWVSDDEVSQNDEDYASVYLGQDFGFTHKNAILKIGFKDDNIYIMKELVSTQKHTGEVIQLAEADEIPKKVLMYCDNAEPDRISMWQQAGYYAIPCEKGAGSVRGQIDWLRQRKIFVHPSCVHTIKELGQWRYKINKITGGSEEEPLEAEDDCMAALRYGTQGYRELYPLVGK